MTQETISAMPRNSTKPKKKLKTHRGAAKRFKITATGKIVRMHSGKRHFTGTKKQGRMRKLKKGFFLTKSKLYQSAQEAANRADRYAFRDRRVKKREYRKLWIQRIGAAARQNGLTYGQLIHGLKAAGVTLDRKVLADLAVLDAAAFGQLAAKATAAAPP